MSDVSETSTIGAFRLLFRTKLFIQNNDRDKKGTAYSIKARSINSDLSGIMLPQDENHTKLLPRSTDYSRRTKSVNPDTD